MGNLFEKTSSNWVRYSDYEWKKDKSGVLYITPAAEAKLNIYDRLSPSSHL